MSGRADGEVRQFHQSVLKTGLRRPMPIISPRHLPAVFYCFQALICQFYQLSNGGVIEFGIRFFVIIGAQICTL